MDIKQTGKRLATVLLVLLSVSILSCAGTKSQETASLTKSASETTQRSPTGQRCHFSTFNIWLPSGWTGKGNTGKLYTTAEREDWFLLVNAVSDPEQDLKEQLELFFGTAFYAGQTILDYEMKEAVAGGTQVEGHLINERKGQTSWFTGYYFAQPKGYVVFFCEDVEDVIPLRIKAEEAYESLELVGSS